MISLQISKIQNGKVSQRFPCEILKLSGIDLYGTTDLPANITIKPIMS